MLVVTSVTGKVCSHDSCNGTETHAGVAKEVFHSALCGAEVCLSVEKTCGHVGGG